MEDSSDEDTVFSASIRRPPADVPFRLHLLTCLAAIGVFLFGYDTGVISGAMLLLRQEFSLSHVWQELIVSATVFSAFLSSLVAGSMSDRWGRRVTIIWASSMFSAGSLWL